MVQAWKLSRRRVHWWIGSFRGFRISRWAFIPMKQGKTYLNDLSKSFSFNDIACQSFPYSKLGNLVRPKWIKKDFKSGICLSSPPPLSLSLVLRHLKQHVNTTPLVMMLICGPVGRFTSNLFPIHLTRHCKSKGRRCKSRPSSIPLTIICSGAMP